MNDHIKLINKYKIEYNKYTKKNINKQNGSGKILYLNKSNFMDTLKCNDANIFYDFKNNLYLMNLSPNHLLWRGLSNKMCSELILPGSKNDKFKFEPIWFGSPEVTIIYNTRKMFNYLYEVDSNFIGISEESNFDDAMVYYSKILEENISSTIAYTSNNNLKLIDINNLHNLNILENKFNNNFNQNNFIKLLELNRITPRMKKTIYSLYLINTKNTNINITEVNVENFFNMAKTDIEILNHIKKALSISFRFTLGYKNNIDINLKEKKITEIPSKMETKRENFAVIMKDIRENVIVDYPAITDVNELRVEANNYFENDEFNKISTYDKISKKIIDIKNKTNKFIKNEINQKIIKYITDERKNYMFNTSDMVNSYQTDLEQTLKVINEIESDNNKGYIINTLNDGKIAFKKINENKYELYFNLNIKNKQQYFNKDVIGENCKMCKIANARQWLDEIKNDKISHQLGLSINQSYYDVNPITLQPELTGVSFQNTIDRDLRYENEERILSIPFDHLGTKDSHSDCGNPSKNFPPSGIFLNKVPICGAYLYADSLDDDVIYGFLGAYNAAFTYANKKYGKNNFEMAEINYNSPKGLFYKYKEEKSENPQIYLLLHCKFNSEPHIHVHTYIDADGTNLKKLRESIKYKFNKTEFDKNKIKDSDILQLFGAKCFSELSKLPNPKLQSSSPPSSIINKNNLYLNLQPKCNSKSTNIKWIKSTSWRGKDNKVSLEKLRKSCSFEYLFKRILGIKDDDPRMKHIWKFPKPKYEFQPNIYNQPELYGKNLENSYTSIRKYQIDYHTKLLNIINPKENNLAFRESPNLPQDIIENTRTLNQIYTNYGINTNGEAMIRQSQTELDALMVLFMQFATLDDPNIAGYVGSSTPLVNKWKNITHPEICLFNTRDYPLKTVFNQSLSTCYNIEQNNINIKLMLFLYHIYFYEHQKQYIIDGIKYCKKDLILEFLFSDTPSINDTDHHNKNSFFEIVDYDNEDDNLIDTDNDYNYDNLVNTDYDYKNLDSNKLLGGKAKIDMNTDKFNLNFLNKINIKSNISDIQNINKNDIKKEYKSNLSLHFETQYEHTPITQILFYDYFKDMDQTINTFNSITTKYKLETLLEKKIAKNILTHLYNNSIPSASQINNIFDN